MLSKGHKKTGVCTKLDSQSLSVLKLSFSNFTINCIFPHFIEFYRRKLSFPVFPKTNNESTSKFIQRHSSPQHKRKQGSYFFCNLVRAFNAVSCLCYIGVHFAVLRSSRQIFPLYESFYSLLNHYWTRKKSCT